MMRRYPCCLARIPLLLFVLLTVPGVPQSYSQEIPSQKPRILIQWEDCPCIGKLGDIATISVPKGFRFVGQDGAIKFMELNQNPTSGNELGVVLGKTETGGWFVVFEFDESGYVKDDEKDTLDADAILNSIRKGNEAANEVRRSKGWTPLEIRGWQRRPFYDSRTNNLTWSIKAKSNNEEVINHSVRLLGRWGVMRADLIAEPQQLTMAVPDFDSLLGSYTFNPGHRYGEWRKGDKIASYGLTALIAGGAGAVAAKTGLLAKFWKLIVVAVIACGAAINRFFSAIFSRGVEQPPDLPKQE